MGAARFWTFVCALAETTGWVARWLLVNRRVPEEAGAPCVARAMVCWLFVMSCEARREMRSRVRAGVRAGVRVGGKQLSRLTNIFT